MESGRAGLAARRVVVLDLGNGNGGQGLGQHQGKRQFPKHRGDLISYRQMAQFYSLRHLKAMPAADPTVT
jgi:hypothetical protein